MGKKEKQIKQQSMKWTGKNKSKKARYHKTKTNSLETFLGQGKRSDDPISLSISRFPLCFSCRGNGRPLTACWTPDSLPSQPAAHSHTEFMINKISHKFLESPLCDTILLSVLGC